MKLVAAALAGALVSGVGVYLWRDAELDARQERLIRTALAQTSAELAVERLEQVVEELRLDLDRLRGDLARPDADGDRALEAPALSVEPDGRYFGYIEWIDTDASPPVLVTDFADFLSGAEANRAAEEAGQIEPGEGVPNDYFITNVNPRLRTLQLDPNLRVVIETGGSTGGPERRPIAFDRFVQVFGRETGRLAGIAVNGYWITIENGRVTRLREQWVP